MTISDLAPAIGGILLGGGGYLYILYLRRKLHAEQKANPFTRA